MLLFEKILEEYDRPVGKSRSKIPVTQGIAWAVT